MNKKLVVAAVAAALVAPLAAAAETTLYGRLHNSLEYVDGDAIQLFYDPTRDEITETDIEADGEWNVRSETTRIGVKGSEDLGNGLKAIFQAEWAFNSAEGGSTAGGLANRLAYAGLTGGWGTVAIGRQWTPYYGAVDKTDIFNGGSFNAHYIGTFRTGNALSYVSPSFAGFVVKGALVMDAGDDKDVDAYNLSAEYNNGGASVGIGYHDNQITDFKGWGIGGSYNFGMAKIIGQYEDWDLADLTGVSDTADWKEWSLAAEGYFGNNTIRGLFGNLDYDVDDQNFWVIGVQHNFSKRTRVYSEYGDIAGVGQNNDQPNQIAVVQDGKIFNVGVRHDF